MHVSRFGPAILYATEGFESFNAVIRDHSVHSNHQAPSRNIARGFARCNRNRHLLSKGLFLRPEILVGDDPSTRTSYYSDDLNDWVTVGPLTFALIRPRAQGKNPVAEAFGLTIDYNKSIGPPGTSNQLFSESRFDFFKVIAFQQPVLYITSPIHLCFHSNNFLNALSPPIPRHYHSISIPLPSPPTFQPIVLVILF